MVNVPMFSRGGGFCTNILWRDRGLPESSSIVMFHYVKDYFEEFAEEILALHEAFSV